jgi:hypothetical protein
MWNNSNVGKIRRQTKVGKNSSPSGRLAKVQRAQIILLLLLLLFLVFSLFLWGFCSSDKQRINWRNEEQQNAITFYLRNHYFLLQLLCCIGRFAS